VKIFFFDWHYSRVQWKVFSVLFPLKNGGKYFPCPQVHHSLEKKIEVT
jgi:hypothetical protein